MHTLARFACFAAFALASALPRSAGAEPKWLRLSIVQEPSSSMTVTWHTVNPASSNVQYGVSTANLDKSAVGSSTLGTGAFGYIHAATMTQLQPDTKYYYRVGEQADGWSATFSFRTAPSYQGDCGKFRFVFLGDNRPDSILGLGDNWSSIFAEAVGEDPGFVLSGGDLVYSGEENGEWVDFLDWTGEPARFSPLMPAMGNHDRDTTIGDTAQYNQLFTLPRSSGTGSSGTEDYYYFTYGNAIFVSINTEVYTGGATPFADQAAWLDAVLTSNPRRWKFVNLHHPIYCADTLLSHPPNEQSQNAALVTVFDKHHVDFVLQGHNHWYERFEPSNCSSQGDPGSSQACSQGADGFDQGTVYMTSGGAGAITILYCGSANGQATCKTDHHYVIFDIDNDALHMQTWASSHQTWGVNASNHKLIDELSIAKSGGVCPSNDAGAPDAPAEAAPDAPMDSHEASAPDGPAKDSAAPKPDAPPPNHPDASTGDEPQPAVVENPASTPTGETGGCSCRLSPSPAAPATAAWLLVLLALVRRRREPRP